MSAATSTAPNAALNARALSIVAAAEKMWERQNGAGGAPFPRQLYLMRAIKMISDADAKTAAPPAPRLSVVPQNALLTGHPVNAEPGLAAHTAEVASSGGNAAHSLAVQPAAVATTAAVGTPVGSAAPTVSAGGATNAAITTAAATPPAPGDPTLTGDTANAPVGGTPTGQGHDASQWTGAAFSQALDDNQLRLWGSPGIYWFIQNLGANGVRFWPGRDQGQPGNDALKIVRDFRRAQTGVAQYRAFLRAYFHCVYAPYVVYFLNRVVGVSAQVPRADAAQIKSRWAAQYTHGFAPPSDQECGELAARDTFPFLHAEGLYSDAGATNTVQGGGKPYSYVHPYLPGGPGSLGQLNEAHFKGGFSTDVFASYMRDTRDFFSVFVTAPSDEAVLLEIAQLGATRAQTGAGFSAFSSTQCGLLKKWSNADTIRAQLSPHLVTDAGAVHYNRLWRLLYEQSLQSVTVRTRNVFHQSMWTKVGGFVLKVVRPLFTLAAVVGGVTNSSSLMAAGLIGTGLANAFDPVPPSAEQVNNFNNGLTTTESPEALKQRYLNTGGFDDTSAVAVLSGYQSRFGDMDAPAYCAAEMVQDIERVIFGGIFLSRLGNGNGEYAGVSQRIAPGFFTDPDLFVSYYLGFMLDSSRVLGFSHDGLSSNYKVGSGNGGSSGGLPGTEDPSRSAYSAPGYAAKQIIDSALATAVVGAATDVEKLNKRDNELARANGGQTVPLPAGIVAVGSRGWLVPALSSQRSWAPPQFLNNQRSSGYAPWLFWAAGTPAAGSTGRAPLNGTNAFLLLPNFISQAERLLTFSILETRFTSFDWRTIRGVRSEAGCYAPDVFETAAAPFFPVDDSRAKPTIHYLQPATFTGFGPDAGGATPAGDGSGAVAGAGGAPGNVFDNPSTGDQSLPSAASLLTTEQRVAEARRIQEQQLAALSTTNPQDGFPLKRPRTMRDHLLFHRDGNLVAPPNLENPLERIRWLNEQREQQSQLEIEQGAPKHYRVAETPLAQVLQSGALVQSMLALRAPVLSHFRPAFVRYDLQRGADERDVQVAFQRQDLDAWRQIALRDAPPNENFAIPLRPFLPLAPNDSAAIAQETARSLSRPFTRAFV